MPHRVQRLIWALAALCWMGSLLAAGAAAAADPPAAACRQTAFEGDRFTVCRYAPRTDEVRLVSRDGRGPLGSLLGVRRWLGSDAARLAFAMNAGMYDDAQQPLGLFVTDSRTVRPLNLAQGSGNFFLKPNGVFWVSGDGVPHVDETGVFASLHVRPRLATQSGPLLFAAGVLNPQIAANGASLAIRNGVGIRGNEALFVISDAPVSFGRLARFLRDGLGCRDGLYFDGAVSSLWAPDMGRLDRRDGLGTFVVVLHAPVRAPAGRTSPPSR